jgi:hypothetical protein
MTDMICLFAKNILKNSMMDEDRYFASQDTVFPFHSVSHAYRDVVLITAPVRSLPRLSKHER